MGLDGVEIVMRTEETFGIEIPNKVAARLLTPAALVDYVAANVPMKATEECRSQQMFYRLRRGFRSQLKALSSAFEPRHAAERNPAQGSMAAGLGGNPR